MAITSFCLLAACSSGIRRAAPADSPTPVSAAGLALAPTPAALDSPAPEAHDWAQRAKLCVGDFVRGADSIGDTLWIGCAQGKLFVLNRRMEELRSTMLPMSVDSIMPAGPNAVAVTGTNDGAVLREELTLLNAATLQPIVHHDMTDSTFLGVYDGRAYIDDWCCNGRADTYAPATIYSVSLKDGSESARVDLAPDPDAHPAQLAPIGQGESNYRIGKYFYVHVQEITYRYDLTDLQAPPVRMRSSVPWGPGTTP